MLNHRLFPELSLQQIDEENSELEQSIVERLTTENKNIMESYTGMIERLTEMELKSEQQEQMIE